MLVLGLWFAGRVSPATRAVLLPAPAVSGGLIALGLLARLRSTGWLILGAVAVLLTCSLLLAAMATVRARLRVARQQDRAHDDLAGWSEQSLRLMRDQQFLAIHGAFGAVASGVLLGVSIITR